MTDKNVLEFPVLCLCFLSISTFGSVYVLLEVRMGMVPLEAKSALSSRLLLFWLPINAAKQTIHCQYNELEL
jgi:hypothetical protein